MNNSARSNMIVVGVDHSAAATAAVAWAAAEARRRGASLHLLHGDGPSAADNSVPFGLQGATSHSRESAGQILLERLRLAANAVSPDVVVTTELGRDPVDALRGASEKAILTVVGAHRGGPAANLLFGSVSSRLAGHVRCPVVVVPAEADAGAASPTGPVVVGVDETPSCEDVLAFAFEEAAFRNVPLIAVHSWDEQPIHTLLNSYPLLLDRSTIDGEEQRMLAEQLAGWSEKYPEVEVRQVILQGRPETTLAETINSAGVPVLAALMVVGTHGATRATHMVPASTSHALLMRTHFPVAVVRSTVVS